MAIARINGQMLQQTLERAGVNLSVTNLFTNTPTVLFDVNNNRLGINTLSPNYSLDVVGNAHLGNLYILGNAIVSETGKIGLGTISNIIVAGGANNNVIVTNGNGNLVFTNIGALPDFVSANATINSINANIGAYQIYANANASTQATSINSINANLGTYQNYANTQVSTINANVGAFEMYANATFATSTSETALSANVGAYQIYANANVGSLTNTVNSINANVGAFELYANTALSTQATSINSINANIGAYQIYANANASTQATSINSINANVGSFETWANVNFVNVLAAYGNSNVATYLPTYTGNLYPGNVTSTFYGNIHADYIFGNTGNVVTITGNGAVRVPIGTTSNRPAGANGYLRFNTDTPALEYFDGSMWVPITNTVTDQQIIPDGASNTYTLQQASTSIGIIVSINGTLQNPNSAYTVTGTQITFTETPLIDDIIDIRFLGAAVTINSTLTDDLVVQGNVTVGGILQIPQATKASNASGTAGQVSWDANYFYICTATNTWKRTPLTGGY